MFDVCISADRKQSKQMFILWWIMFNEHWNMPFKLHCWRINLCKLYFKKFRLNIMKINVVYHVKCNEFWLPFYLLVNTELYLKQIIFLSEVVSMGSGKEGLRSLSHPLLPSTRSWVPMRRNLVSETASGSLGTVNLNSISASVSSSLLWKRCKFKA